MWTSRVRKGDSAVAGVVPWTQRDEIGALVGAWLIGFASPNTRRAYARDIGAWLAWCQTSAVPPRAARREHVDAWLRMQEMSGAAASSRARRLAAVASWYGWLVAEGHADRNPASRVARPTVDPDDSRTVGLTRDQAQTLLACADIDARPTGPRTRALVRLLLANALRVGELIALDVEDLGEARGHRTLRVTGKGGRVHTVPLAPATADALDRYLASRRDVEVLPARAAGARSRRPLFATGSGGRLDQGAIWRLLRRLATDAGPELADVAGRLSPHSLRHTAITAALDAGVSLRDVQDYARHADPRTTRRYDRARHSLDRHATYAVSAYLADDS
jgi:site-specific recombinase XerD